MEFEKKSKRVKTGMEAPLLRVRIHLSSTCALQEEQRREVRGKNFVEIVILSVFC